MDATGTNKMNTKVSLNGKVLKEVESFVSGLNVHQRLAVVPMTLERGWQWVGQ